SGALILLGDGGRELGLRARWRLGLGARLRFRLRFCFRLRSAGGRGFNAAIAHWFAPGWLAARGRRWLVDDHEHGADAGARRLERSLRERFDAAAEGLDAVAQRLGLGVVTKAQSGRGDRHEAPTGRE